MTTLLGNIELYTFELMDQSIALQVEKIAGRESMSTLFEYTVDLICEDEHDITEKILGKSATLTLYAKNSKNDPRYVNGIIVEAEYKGQDDQYSYIRVKLFPQIKLLAYKSDSRIFQDMTVKEIIQSVLKQANFLSTDVEFCLEGTDQKKEYCVQYQESDLSFISRLIAEQGLFYYFKHEQKKHHLVIADNIAAYSDNPKKTKVRYALSQSYVSSSDEVSELVACSRVRSGAVSIASYNYLNPSLELNVKYSDSIDQDLIQFDYPGDFVSVRVGQEESKRRMESMQAYKKVLSGKSDSRTLQVGYRFSLHGHPNSEFNREYVVIDVDHFAAQPQVKRQNAFSENGHFSNRFRCIASDIISRPQFKGSIRPIMRGIQTATVVGPSGEEIYTDKLGRVKVQFRWDRYGNNNEKSSCWLRVSHSWAGNGWGSVFIPRVSQEVIVDFVEGDPDQPVITGCLYNANNMPPLTLPKNKSISGVKSNPLQKSSGSNQFIMDDKAGETRTEICNAYGHKIIQDEKEQTLTIHTRDKHILSLDDKNKSVTLTTSNNHQIKMEDTQSNHAGKITIQSSKGHSFILDDDSRSVMLTSKNGHNITLDDAKDKIILSDKNKKNQFVLDFSSGVIALSTQTGSIHLNAPNGEILLSSKDLSIDVGNDISMKAGNDINSKAAMTLSASAKLISAKASSSHTIKGMPVQIN